MLCYDANASPIRAVQRSGRTGRSRQGRVIHILAAGKEEAQFQKQQAVRSIPGRLRPECGELHALLLISLEHAVQGAWGLRIRAWVTSRTVLILSGSPLPRSSLPLYPSVNWAGSGGAAAPDARAGLLSCTSPTHACCRANSRPSGWSLTWRRRRLRKGTGAAPGQARKGAWAAGAGAGAAAAPARPRRAAGRGLAAPQAAGAVKLLCHEIYRGLTRADRICSHMP